MFSMIIPGLLTLALAAPTAQQSQTTGKIAIFGTVSGNTGFLSINQFAGIYAATGEDVTSASVITIPTSSCSQLATSFNIGATYANSTGLDSYPFLGFLAPSGVEPTDPASSGYTYVVGSSEYASGAKPVRADSTWANGATESSLWTLNCSTKTLTANWISSTTGKAVPLTFLDNSAQYISGVANASAYITTYRATETEVLTFTFIPDTATFYA